MFFIYSRDSFINMIYCGETSTAPEIFQKKAKTSFFNLDLTEKNALIYYVFRTNE